MLATDSLAYALLDDLDIAYVRLDHPPITSVKNLSFSLPGQQVKNLLLKNKKGRQFYLLILKDEKQANLTRLADDLGEKRLSFANAEDVRRLLHVEPGTVTPLGLLFDQEQRIQVIIDDEVNPHDTVGFHPFVNDTTLNITYADFLKFLTYVKHKPRRLLC